MVSKGLVGTLVVLVLVLGMAGCSTAVGGAVEGRPAGSSARPPAEQDELGNEDELWVIDRESPPAAPITRIPLMDRMEDDLGGEDALSTDELPGGGGLVARHPVSRRHVVLPLDRTDVHGRVRGTIGDVEVTQRFVNPYDTKIEAVYVFPLPENGAVRDFLMTIGTRTIRGVVRERAEAERIYERAKRAGKVAALLTQERPNVFTQKVANLEPGNTIDVTLRYFHTLPWIDGAFEFVFPMVVGPRYSPPGTKSGIAAVATGKPGASGQAVEVPYLRPEERSGHDIALAVDLETGFDIQSLQSTTHVLAIERDGKNKARVELDPRDRLPNKDFVLRIRPAGEGVRAGLVAAERNGQGTFALTLVPPADLASIPRSPIEMVFVVDCSGSMKGAPLAIVRNAVHAVLDELRPGDGFQLVRFNRDAQALGRGVLEADASSLTAGHDWLEGLVADGGTEVLAGVRAAFGLERGFARERVVCLMTDGFIANEEEVLRTVRQHRDDTRVFSVGIGSAPNRFLLECLASEGRGAAAYLDANSDAGGVMRRFLERATHPALTDVELDFGRVRVHDVYPASLPDLFLGRTVVVTGRIESVEDQSGSAITVRGIAGGVRRELIVPVRALSAGPAGDPLPWLWARARIADLESRARGAVSEEERARLAAEVRRTALEHGLLSAHTAFLAVDSWSQTAGDHGYTVPVPVHVPDGVRYDTTVAGPR